MWNTKLQLNNIQSEVGALKTEINELILGAGIQNPLQMDINGNNYNINSLNVLQSNTVTANTVSAQTYDLIAGGEGFNNLTINNSVINNSTGNNNTLNNTNLQYGELNTMSLNNCTLATDLNCEDFKLNSVDTITANTGILQNANIANLNGYLGSDLQANNFNISGVNTLTTQNATISDTLNTDNLNITGHLETNSYIELNNNTSSDLGQLHFNYQNEGSHQIGIHQDGALVMEYYPGTGVNYAEMVFNSSNGDVILGNNKKSSPVVCVMGQGSTGATEYGQIYDNTFNKPNLNDILLSSGDAGGNSITNLNNLTVGTLNYTSVNPPFVSSENLTTVLQNGNDAGNNTIRNVNSLNLNSSININGYVQSSSGSILGTNSGQPTLQLCNGTGSQNNKYIMFVNAQGASKAGDFQLINNINNTGPSNVFYTDSQNQNTYIGNDKSLGSVWINAGTNGSVYYKGLVHDTYVNPPCIIASQAYEFGLDKQVQTGTYSQIISFSTNVYPTDDYNNSSYPTLVEMDISNLQFNFNLLASSSNPIIFQWYLSIDNSPYDFTRSNMYQVSFTKPQVTGNGFSSSPNSFKLWFYNSIQPIPNLYLCCKLIGSTGTNTIYFNETLFLTTVIKFSRPKYTILNVQPVY